MADLVIPKAILDDIIAHAKELTPYECCGLLAGTNGVVNKLYRIKNIVAMEGAQNLSSFDSAKAAHLERLSPEERAEIAFVMDMQDFSSAKKICGIMVSISKWSITPIHTIRPVPRSPTLKSRPTTRRFGLRLISLARLSHRLAHECGTRYEDLLDQVRSRHPC